MKIICLVVTFNGEKWISKCLDSLRTSTVNLLPVVIDNASQDSTIEIIKCKYPEVHLINNNKNIGFGKANNLGLKYALLHDADYVLLLNQDAIIHPQMVEKLVWHAEQNREIGILSPLHYNYEGSNLDFGFLSNFLNDRQMLSDAFCNKLKLLYIVSSVNAAIWLLKRSTIEIVGGFDPLFDHGGEDNDYIVRMNYFNIKMALVTDAVAYHSHESFGYNRNYSEVELSNKFYNQWVLVLKHNIGSYFFKFTKFLLIQIVGSLHRVLSLNLSSFRYKGNATIKIIGNAFLIRKHRLMSLSRGRNWI